MAWNPKLLSCVDSYTFFSKLSLTKLSTRDFTQAIIPVLSLNLYSKSVFSNITNIRKETPKAHHSRGWENNGIIHFKHNQSKYVAKILNAGLNFNSKPLSLNGLKITIEETLTSKSQSQITELLSGAKEIQSHFLMEIAGGPKVVDIGLIQTDKGEYDLSFYVVMENAFPNLAQNEKSIALDQLLDRADPEKALNSFVKKSYRDILVKNISDKIIDSLSVGITPGYDAQLMITSYGRAQWIDSESFKLFDKSNLLIQLVETKRIFNQSLVNLKSNRIFSLELYQKALQSKFGKEIREQITKLNINDYEKKLYEYKPWDSSTPLEELEQLKDDFQWALSTIKAN